jgi:hypothetical protein
MASKIMCHEKPQIAPYNLLTNSYSSKQWHISRTKKETLVQKNVHPSKETLVQGASGAAQGHVQH